MTWTVMRRLASLGPESWTHLRRNASPEASRKKARKSTIRPAPIMAAPPARLVTRYSRMSSFGFWICTGVTPGGGLSGAASAVTFSISSAARCTRAIALPGPASSLLAASLNFCTASGSVSMTLPASSRNDQAAEPAPTTIASSKTAEETPRGTLTRSSRSTSGLSA